MLRRVNLILLAAVIVAALHAVGCSNTGSLGIIGAFQPNATVGTPYISTQFTANGGSGTYAWTVSGLPPGLSATGASSSTLTVAGTPTVAGDFTASVTLRDSAGRSTTYTGAINVTTSPTLTINGTLPLAGSVGNAYNATLTATGGSGSYTWDITGLPDGIAATNTSSATVTVSGSPTKAKSYQVSIKLTDSANGTASSSETINISSAAGLTITGALPGTAAVGTAYSGSLTVINGTSPYKWSITGLPDGVAASGTDTATVTIAGTPTLAETYDVNIVVTDAKSATANYTITIVVSAAQSAANSACTSTRLLLGNEAALTQPYAFVLSNTDLYATPVSWAGSFTPDGKGGIQSADLDEISGESGPASYRVNASKSSYSLGADGTGCLSLELDGLNAANTAATSSTHTPNVALGGNAKTALATRITAATVSSTKFTMSFVVSGVYAGQAAQSDPNDKRVVAAGSIFAQTSGDFELSALAPRFAFGAAGWYLETGSEIESTAIAGSIEASFEKGLGTSALVNGAEDQNIGGDVSGELSGVHGEMAAPSQDSGRGTGTYSVETPQGEMAFDFTYYVVDRGDFIFISSDAAQAGNFLIHGRALEAAPPSSSLAGKYTAVMESATLRGAIPSQAMMPHLGDFTVSDGSVAEWTASIGNYGKPSIQRLTNVSLKMESATGRASFSSASAALPVAYLTAPAPSTISTGTIAGFLVGTDDYVTSGTLISIPAPTAH